MLFSLALLFVLNGHAAFGGPARGCAGLEASNILSLPSPVGIDPEDDRAILAFIDGVVPLGSYSVPRALEIAFKKMWMKYRPDLDDAAVTALMKPHWPVPLALVNLRQTKPAEKLGDVGRLRLLWMAFIRHVRPDHPAFDPSVVHRAEIQAVQRKYPSVLAYVRESVAPEVRLDDDSFPRALRGLYEAYLPGTRIPPLLLTATATYDRGQQLVKLWDAYVKIVIAGPKTKPAVGTSGATFVDPTLDPKDVPDDITVMVWYLINRYPKIDRFENRAIFRYVQSLRDEWDLGPSLIDIAPKAAVTLLTRRDTHLMEGHMRAIWGEFLRDRAKKQKAR